MKRFPPNPNNYVGRQPYSGYNSPQSTEYSYPAQQPSRTNYPPQPQQTYNSNYGQTQQQQQTYTSNNVSQPACGGINIINMIDKAFCEFLGSCFLVFIVCLAYYFTLNKYIFGPTLGLTLIGLHHIFGEKSGGHFNPAISIAHWIMNVPHFIEVPLYIVGQILGAIVGYGFYEAILPIDLNQIQYKNYKLKSEDAPCVTYYDRKFIGQAFAAEFLLTFILTLAYCSTWDKRNEHLKDSASLKIGLLAMVLCTISYPLSGGNLNFVRSFGPAVFHPKIDKGPGKDITAFIDLWLYFFGPILGSIFGAVIYKFVILRDHTCTNKETE